MYIVNDIAYAGEPEPILQVKSVRPLPGHRLWLRFSTGEEKEFDFKPLLQMPCWKPLKDISVFNDVYLDYGVPVWQGGAIDIAPEKLYHDGVIIN